jgi:hypothetical protein
MSNATQNATIYLVLLSTRWLSKKLTLVLEALLEHDDHLRPVDVEKHCCNLKGAKRGNHQKYTETMHFRH